MNLTTEEQKLIYNALLYWRRYKTLYESHEYQLCLKLLNQMKA